MTTVTKKLEIWPADRIANYMKSLAALSIQYTQEQMDLWDRMAEIERQRLEVQAHCPHAIRYVDHDVVDGRTYFLCEACKMVLEPAEKCRIAAGYETPIFARK